MQYAAFKPDHTHCFACQQPLYDEGESSPSHEAGLLHGRYQLGTCLGSGGSVWER